MCRAPAIRTGAGPERGIPGRSVGPLSAGPERKQTTEPLGVRLQRGGGRALRQAARGVAAIDRVRWSADRATRRSAAPDPPDEPTALFAAISHWRSDPVHGEDRQWCLGLVVESLLAMELDRVVAVVVTNDVDGACRDLTRLVSDLDAGDALVRVADADAVLGRPRRREIVVVRWKPGPVRRHGYYLTWGHKPVLRRAARSGQFSHLAYLEDDMRLTDAHLRYWCRYRRPLAPLGLLPGFVRVEHRDGATYVVDQADPVDPIRRFTAVVPDGLCTEFVQMTSPYQGMYLLDRPLWADHFRFSPARSAFRSRALPEGVRERAATGPIYDRPPTGLRASNVVPVHVGQVMSIDPACLIDHVSGTYSRLPDEAWGKVPLDGVFTPLADLGTPRPPDGAPRTTSDR